MLRRLVHRFSEQGGDGAGAQATAPGYQNDGRISSEVVQDIELDVDREEVRLRSNNSLFLSGNKAKLCF